MSRILIIEDGAPLREVLCEYLTDEGYDIDSAESGDNGIELINRQEYDLILTDIRIPGKNGFEVVEHANRLCPNTPKVIMTAYTEMEDTLKAIRLGAYDFIQKPIRNLWELGALAKRALAHRQLLLVHEEHQRKIEQMNRDLQMLNSNLEDEVNRRTEDLSQANLKLRTLDEMKNNLLANISHELRTPLVSVRGYTELFLSGRLCDIPDDCMKYFETSLRNIDKLLALIESLVTYADLARGDTKLELEKVDLSLMMRSIRERYKGKAAEEDITLELSIPDEIVEVNADLSRFEEAVANVVDNAIKFNTKGGKVDIDLALVGQKLVKVTIVDSGVGIAPEEQMRIFERFYQVDASATRSHGGTGIGLAIARDNLRLLGCELRVSSSPGDGSTFYFTIPRAYIPQKG